MKRRFDVSASAAAAAAASSDSAAAAAEFAESAAPARWRRRRRRRRRSGRSCRRCCCSAAADYDAAAGKAPVAACDGWRAALRSRAKVTASFRVGPARRRGPTGRETRTAAERAPPPPAPLIGMTWTQPAPTRRRQRRRRRRHHPAAVAAAAAAGGEADIADAAGTPQAANGERGRRSGARSDCSNEAKATAIGCEEGSSGRSGARPYRAGTAGRSGSTSTCRRRAGGRATGRGWRHRGWLSAFQPPLTRSS